ncbi:hypothetical protein [Wolbachia endosymbiont of Ctenocephalides felis wCfeJ]|uniref:hypothetical protein n=1 Tax=Wolbachia endosymbiont of Ctenocephalides felis wCfeJ TaxID=2732594 RepID=UPI001FE53E2A|nr:hypothetical protein [Wolbachia endosymbiont of Ctenocephalides felis wCfeJ]WCR58133.1 MAG: hypothetical protein PG980_000605 [Wolbachia endosymbiont of Ctenocephalides felis wCfeJ]
MFILSKLFETNSTTLKVQEAIGFNPRNVGLVEGNGVAYGLSYQDNGNGSSKVKLLVSPLYQSKTYEYDTCVNVANEFKDQLSIILIEDLAEVDEVGVIFPEEDNKEGKKYIKGLMFSTYKIKHSGKMPLVELSDKTKLQKNANDCNPANKDNSYFQPKAVKVDNNDIIVIAHNLKDQILVSWYLESKGDGKFKALRGKNSIIERKLFKFDDPGQLVLTEETMLYARMSGITKIRKTQIFKFDVAKVVQSLKDKKETNECLLSKKGGQIDNKALSLSSKHEISFLQHVKQTKGNDLVAFLAKGQSSNTQELHLASFTKNGSKSDFVIHEFKDPVDQLYVKDGDQGCFITTAIRGENIITFNHKNSEKPRKVTMIPANSIKALGDFVNIINGRLTPSLISSSTMVPITTTEKVETSTKTSTTAITSITKTDTLETTHPSKAELTTQTSTVSTTAIAASKATMVTTEDKTSTAKPATAKPTTVVVTTATPKATKVTSSTKTRTVDPTTVRPTTSKTTVTSRATVVATKSTKVPTVTLDSTANTEKLTTLTILSTPAVSSTTQPSTEPTTQASTVSTTVKPTTSETTVTSKATTVTTDADEISTAKSTTAKPTTAATTSQTTTVTTGVDKTSAKPTSITVPLTSTASSTAMSKPSTESTTQASTAKSTTVAETTATSQATTVNAALTNVPTANLEKTTQTVFTIPSIKIKGSTTSVFTTTLLPQITSSPQPGQLTIASAPNEAGIITGSLLGVVGVFGIIGFIAYKCVRKYHHDNATPVLELSDLESHSNSSGELFVSNSRTSSPEIVLDSVSIESGSRLSSPSPGGSKSSESKSESGLSWDSNDVPEYHL